MKAAVDSEIGTGDGAGRRAGQVDDRGGDLVGRHEPSERLPVTERGAGGGRVLGLFEQPPDPRCVDGARAHTVDPDTVGEMVGGHGQGEGVDGALAGPVQHPFRPYASTGLDEPDDRMPEIIAAVRAAVGPDFVIMVDVGYAWDSAQHARAVIETWVPHDVYFVETPLWADDIDGYAELARTSPIPIAAGEWLATRFEFRELVERGCLQILQPDVGRVGGLTEARRVCQLGKHNGLRVVPHCWKSGISVAATGHLAAVTSNMPFFECVPKDMAESALRRDLLREDLDVVDGQLVLPDAPGLGIELDEAALHRFERAASARWAG